MKKRVMHVEPLSRQALEIITAVRALGFKSKYVFPSVTTNLKPLSENTVNTALRRMGWTKEQMCAHGFRGTASTLLNEARRADGSRMWSADAIERSLAHQDQDVTRASYNRSKAWPERVEMAQWWSDYLDGLREDLPARREVAA